MDKKIDLGVNVDHVATLRQARGTVYPSPVEAAKIIEKAGANNITCHLREDRRHIQDQDVYDLSETLSIPLNFEMAAREEMFKIAQDIKPHTVTIVPEKREELTTEHGLDIKQLDYNALKWIETLKELGCKVSLFIDASATSIDACINYGISEIEIHTGFYADAVNEINKKAEFEKIAGAVDYAHSKGLSCHLGHGLNQKNLGVFRTLPVKSMQIGHALIADAIYVGLEQSTQQYLKLLQF
ncbi:MAG TPA: pyridoxine 5'-phosphate synthase [Oligoflexia bacterium]|nr:pyridoxine 5'-phosphate synthase [Oligoflexia bacterium]HMR24168.1 pyridoxine 5'-phosphate synthase [Oligoflexia bacterium]